MGADWQLVYDATMAGAPLKLLFGLICLPVAWFLPRLIEAARDQAQSRAPHLPPSRSRAAADVVRRIGKALLVAVTALFLITWLLAFLDDAAARRAVRSGAAFTVEGPVRDLRPRGSRGPDRFTVAGIEFAVPNGAGYDRTSREGSPLRDGLEVRIHAMRAPRCEERCPPVIVRLEVRW